MKDLVYFDITADCSVMTSNIALNILQLLRVRVMGVACQYGEWMKALGSRARSPNRRGQARDMDDHVDDEKRTNQQQVKDMVGQ